MTLLLANKKGNVAEEKKCLNYSFVLSTGFQSHQGRKKDKSQANHREAKGVLSKKRF